jgi:hypothetical protein
VVEVGQDALQMFDRACRWVWRCAHDVERKLRPRDERRELGARGGDREHVRPWPLYSHERILPVQMWA